MKFNKKLIFIILIFSLILSGCAENNKDQLNDSIGEVNEDDNQKLKIVLGAKEDGQPYIYKDGDEVKGFEADMWKEISERANFDIEYKFNSISGLFGLLDTEEIDTVTHFIAMTDERKEKYQFTDSYAEYGLKFMIKDTTPEINSLEDLHGKKVAVALGSAAAGVIQRLDPDKNIELVPYEEFRSIPMDIENERVYAYFGNPVTMEGDIRNMNLNCKISPKAFTENYIGYPFRKDDKKAEVYMDRINKALEEMKEEGIIKELSQKWFYMDVTDE